MKKTLLLCFIHGFKGTDSTFENFPSDLRALLAHSLPNLDVLSVQYPRYETRGELKECVGRFKEWLQNKVIDLEVANRTPSPTVDPSVHVVLCGHSMGGIVAAEALLSIARPTNLAPPTEEEDRASSAPPANSTALFFPHISAVISFDTPYLGISPGVLAYGAEEQLNHASSAYKAFDSASSFFGWNSPKNTTPIPDAASRGLPAPANASSGSWNKWGKYAAFGGAAAALAGAAGAAYLSRDQISKGFSWAGSHLEFVNTLARGAELQKRVERVVQLTQSHHVGFVNFYTALGDKRSTHTKYAGALLDKDRTFCEFARDSSKSKGHWIRSVNEAVGDEVQAHTSMFSRKANPGYHAMLPAARDEIVNSIDRRWYGALGSDHTADPRASDWNDNDEDAAGGADMGETEEMEAAG
ncbi:hypothetical protein BDY17DRAFT_246123 [Neohortaea acidophila]|uniref:AB hydrolase-1 domain-containing protein n=1 Tax=Neohortaea acidophila TaxID=245834 RepID=A0A6A6Q2T6_9PEZI|nr:uncharacterized protein BDY17DRAFT_246123 [Neohortaea acidophila]KAF2486304.1 hypothetical protein BDY17DRAFT_246123 [Neohortaea acidophila]